MSTLLISPEEEFSRFAKKLKEDEEWLWSYHLHLVYADVSGIFIARESQLLDAFPIPRKIWFGEIAGKGSSIDIYLSFDTFIKLPQSNNLDRTDKEVYCMGLNPILMVRDD
jgi:hypothetical protein